MPAPLVVAPILAALMAWFSRIMMVKAGIWVVATLTYLGIYFGTQEMFIEPLINQVRTIAENNITGTLAEWVAFLNFDRAISMILSAYLTAGSIAATKMALFRRT